MVREIHDCCRVLNTSTKPHTIFVSKWYDIVIVLVLSVYTETLSTKKNEKSLVLVGMMCMVPFGVDQ